MRTVAAPMPLLPPVTTATLPARLNRSSAKAHPLRAFKPKPVILRWPRSFAALEGCTAEASPQAAVWHRLGRRPSRLARRARAPQDDGSESRNLLRSTSHPEICLPHAVVGQQLRAGARERDAAGL